MNVPNFIVIKKLSLNLMVAQQGRSGDYQSQQVLSYVDHEYLHKISLQSIQ